MCVCECEANERANFLSAAAVSVCGWVGWGVRERASFWMDEGRFRNVGVFASMKELLARKKGN